MSSNHDSLRLTLQPDQTQSVPPSVLTPHGTSTPGSMGIRAATAPTQDLSGDKLILSALRIPFNGMSVPSLGGIPLLSKLGQGGMGAVYFGFHPRLNQEVAVKVLPFEMAEKHPAAIERFFREAQLAASVKSPHLVGVLDVNQERGLFYIVMEYVEGVSGQAYLREVVKSGATGLCEIVALDLCIATCTGLAVAHARGIIHRDVKPDNILIPRNKQTRELNVEGAQLADLGLARSEMMGEAAATRTEACMGTPGFMSPEQAKDAKSCGKPADVFSMGATLYALLSGRSPFGGGGAPLQMVMATINDLHTPVRDLRPEISAATADLLDRCLAKEPVKRYADASALLAALKVCRAGLTTLRIFISSPGDVAEEREKALLVIDQLQRIYGSRVKLLPVLWEELPLQPDASFQDGIDLVLSAEHGIDIAVFILWSRLGSPLGGANCKPDGSPFQSGTERELYLMLEARKQEGGTRPQILVYARNDKGSFEDRLEAVDRAELLDFIEQRRLAASFIREHFHDDQGHIARACYSYDKPITFAGRLKVHLRAMIDEMLGDGAIAGKHWEHDPYRGLQVFDLEHAPIFFGREHEVCELQELLRRRSAAGCGFAVIVGASGSGKSSLARAGVAAALVRDNLDSAVKQWRLTVIQPSAVEGGPFTGLVNAITKAEALPELLDNNASKEDIASGLGRDAKLTTQLSFKPAFDRAAQKANGAVKLFLILDQTEELWTDRNLTNDVRERFLKAIEALAQSGLVWVLATLRTDFYPLAQLSETFLRLKGNDGGYDLVAPGPDALQRIIAEPARLAGVQFERNERAGQSLDQAILRDAIGQPDALPLLEYALDQLFKETSATRQLTFAVYEKMGGVEGALGKKAEAEFIRLPSGVQAVFGSVMNALVTVDADAEAQALRRTAPLGSVTDTEARKALVDVLIKNRLLTADKEGGNPVVRVAHEALLRRWDRLVTWISANREYLRLRARVEQSQARWQQCERDTSLLLPLGLTLEEGNKLLRGAPDLLTADTKAYIQQSVQNHEAAAKRTRTVRRIVTSALAAMLLFAIGGAIAGFVGMGKANEKTKEAESAAKEQRRLSFEAIVRIAEADDTLGESAKVISALEPYLLEQELAQHPMRGKAEKMVERARDGYKRLAAFAEEIGKGEQNVSLDLGHGVMLEVIVIPAGTFMMGRPETEKVGYLGERPQHEVTISKPYYMGKFTVTQEQYEEVAGTNPSNFKGKKNPVESVNWFEAVAFCEKLNKQSGTAKVAFALPTEAQWEYACRAGTTTRYYFGDDEKGTELEKYAWFNKNVGTKFSNYGAQPVGGKPANPFGLYDMHGNVFQWCADWYDQEYYKNSPTVDPTGPKEGVVQTQNKSSARVLRGGSWDAVSTYCRSAARAWLTPTYRNSLNGFRCIVLPLD